MKYKIISFFSLIYLVVFSLNLGWAQQDNQSIPPLLRDWVDWATWEDKHQSCPTLYADEKRHLCVWPSMLEFDSGATGATFSFAVEVFHESWIALPGEQKLWPLNVRGNGALLAVVEKKGRPSVKLKRGSHRITGDFLWGDDEEAVPQKVYIPREIGVLTLRLDGKNVALPNWDQQGYLWLKRKRREATDRDFLSVKVYRNIQDGIPMWLRTEIELSVSGKSREEELGCVLPEGWKLSRVNSPVPVAVDEMGNMKVQVRTGKWKISMDAFSTSPVDTFAYASSAQPMTAVELVAFQASSSLRMVEVVGAPSVDVSQTTFPKKWHHLPVYQWETARAFKLQEKMRGMGVQKPEGLRVIRELWLDENGQGFTYRDRIQGDTQEIWRLDVMEGQELGRVKMNDEGQLITRNPKTNAVGVEVRQRNVKMDAVGRMQREGAFPAIGWNTDADALDMRLNLPPGWRLLYWAGGENVEGSWWDAWDLLDVFLLMVFTMAIFKLWGWVPALVALLGLGLVYHEPFAPKFAWLFLLMPLALLRVVPAGVVRNLIVVWKYFALVLLLGWLLPFYTQQIQALLYPQLEDRYSFGSRNWNVFNTIDSERATSARAEADMMLDAVEVQETMPVPQQTATLARTPEDHRKSKAGFSRSVKSSSFKQMDKSGQLLPKSNLMYAPQARIQTGPGVPEWNWNTVSASWNGPIVSEQMTRPILISLNLQRFIILVRLILLGWILAILLDIKKWKLPLVKMRHTATKALLIGFFLLSCGMHGFAQIPDKEMLETLRQRVLEKSDAYPNAADIPRASLRLLDNRLMVDVQVNAAVETAVPLPGRLPDWSPVRVTVNDLGQAVLRREQGYLWVVVPQGVSQVRIEGVLPDTAEWEWTFLLKPRYVEIDAPSWKVTGVNPSGQVEQQVFFVKQQKIQDKDVAYDRKDFNAVVQVDRALEIGLRWQVSSYVRRLSSQGKAVSLRIPLLPGEKVLTSGVQVKQGSVEVRLAANQSSFSWVSELDETAQVKLKAAESAQWVERWQLISSPVWHVSLHGLKPVFESSNRDLIPVWKPWPGESVELSFSRPEAVSGATMTVKRVKHRLNLGQRNRTTTLKMDVQCSIGEDMLFDIPQDAEVISLKRKEERLPVRRDGAKLIIPLRPGEQQLTIVWEQPKGIETVVQSSKIDLPVESSNINTVFHLPGDRWVLWTAGPLRGPAVQFWVILILAGMIAWLLSYFPLSPLKWWEWLFLSVGLTQMHMMSSLLIIAWLFLLAWRGRDGVAAKIKVAWQFNLLQAGIIILTGIVLLVMTGEVIGRFTGYPIMFISGNDSHDSTLKWFQARAEDVLPMPQLVSVSIWFYKVLIFVWATVLAFSLIKWLRWGWEQFSLGGFFRKLESDSRKDRNKVKPPELPKQDESA